jgi:hypothetical protein
VNASLENVLCVPRLPFPLLERIGIRTANRHEELLPCCRLAIDEQREERRVCCCLLSEVNKRHKRCEDNRAPSRVERKEGRHTPWRKSKRFPDGPTYSFMSRVKHDIRSNSEVPNTLQGRGESSGETSNAWVGKTQGLSQSGYSNLVTTILIQENILAS